MTPEEQKWMDAQVEKYKEEYAKYKRFAEKLNQVLEALVKKYVPKAMVQTREKAVASFAGKVLKKKDKYRDPVHQLTDLCGGRIITNTSDEVKIVCDNIEKHFIVDKENSENVSERLKPNVFGYKSIHYVIQFKREGFPRDIGIEIPEEFLELKAEIQVRTLLEHAWAAFEHSCGYKGSFDIPKKFSHELARLSAVLEEADNAFSRIQSGLKQYESSYEAYMTETEMLEEIKTLETIKKYDPENVKLAQRIGKIHMKLENWEEAVDVLGKYESYGYPPLLKDLGISLCKLHDACDDGFKKGQKYLEEAIRLGINDVDAFSSLGSTWRKAGNDEEARRLYSRAYETNPYDPYSLGMYLEYEIEYRKDASIIPAIKPVIDVAIEKCNNLIEVGIDLPWPLYNIGKFYLLMCRIDESIEAYLKAVRHSPSEWMVEISLKSIEKLSRVAGLKENCHKVKELLLAEAKAKFPSFREEKD